MIGFFYSCLNCSEIFVRVAKIDGYIPAMVETLIPSMILIKTISYERDTGMVETMLFGNEIHP